jgi:Holliday junction resolvase RusA-like endonuclease
MKQERNSENATAVPTGKQFIINGAHYKEKCFPGLNDLLREAERHPMAYNKMKRDYETVATSAIRRHLRGYKAQSKVILHYTFGEPSRGKKRDYDNIVAAGRKIINDALVKTKTIVDDNPNYLGYGTNNFVYVDTPFIKVEIEETNDED